MTRLTATEVARSFSSVANRVSEGEEIEVVRNGVRIMRLSPARPPRMLSIARWRELMAALPAVDDDFARDVEAARERLEPPRGAWPS
jgi:antitoxin (DNA-binding transcriptional repressor) of toxin-antitoxin stability system